MKRPRTRSGRAGRAKKISYHRVKTAVGKLPLHIYFTVLLVFACSLGVVFVNAYMQDLRSQIDRTRREIVSERETNAVIEAGIDRHHSLEYIAERAEALGMHPPDPSRIVHINVPRRSFVIRAEDAPEQDTQGMWGSAWRYIVGWFRW